MLLFIRRSRIQGLLEHFIQRPGAHTPLARRRQDLDLLRWDAHILGKPGGTQVPNQIGQILLGASAHEKEVAFHVAQLRGLPVIDPVGVHDNQALLGLSENLRQPGHRQLFTPEHITEGEARPHRRQLIRITNQNQALALGDGLQKVVQQLNVHHRHFVHDDGIGLQGIVLVLRKVHLPCVLIDPSFQKPMDGGSLLPGNLAHALGSPPRRGRYQTFQLHIAVEAQNAIQQSRLAGAGAAGDEQQPGARRLPNGLGLLGGVIDTALPLGLGNPFLQVVRLRERLVGQFL